MQSVEKILMSVMSMLSEPNCDSPANIDAGKMYREDRKAFEDRVHRDVRASLGIE